MNDELMTRYIAGDATEEERARMAEWLDASPENMREFQTLRRLHDILLWQSPSEGAVRRLPGRSGKLVRTLLKSAAAAAAALLIWLGAHWLLSSRNTYSGPEMHTVQVPAGQHKELQLSDGTEVWLNANSTLTFPDRFDGAERKVTLSGEGYFDVVSNPSAPFIVETGMYDIRVLGTEFDVLAYEADSLFETSLIRGRVEVSDHQRRTRLVLEPDERVHIRGGHLVKTAIPNHSRFLWKEGLIAFDNERFGNMVLRMERYFGVEIVVRNRRLANRRYTGKFRARDGVEQILKVLSLDNGFSYRTEDSTGRIIID